MFKNLTNSVTGWLGVVRPDDDDPPYEPTVKNEESQSSAAAAADKAQSQTEETSKADVIVGDTPATKEQGEDHQHDHDVQHQLDEMGTKAINTAKEWGTWLYGVGKTATAEVVKTAKNLKDTVEEKTILGEFQREQEKYISENREKKQRSEAAVPPWVGYNEEEAMKQQILALSQDKRNFLRNPPAGVQFNFDYEALFPVAIATMQEDPELDKMRFELVPKQVKEEIFWRNYFYRVSLIKQSAQLTSLAQQTGSLDNSDKKSKESKPVDVNQRGSTPSVTEPDDLPSSSPPDNEFISDAFQSGEFSEEDLKKEMQSLGMGGEKEDIPEWERELQAELQEYEVVNEDNDDDLDAADLEQEILQQIEAESKK